jgi:N-acetylglucosaminyldiphosphoundecaprenol N-acetyl-beta-D-mannosaminyltransferase
MQQIETQVQVGAGESASDCRKGPHPPGFETVELFDIVFSNVTFHELCKLVEWRIATREPAYIATPNVDHICQYHRNDEFREAYADAWMVLCDGMPIIWASRWLGAPLKEKLSGSDLVIWLSELAANRGFSVYFFGAPEGVAAMAAEQLKARIPDLKVAGVQCPPFGFYEDAGQNAAAVGEIRRAAPDICFVALSAPNQELWMMKNREVCAVPVMIGVGGSFDFVCGRVRRAPVWMQKAGLEWFWRLCHEPKRLWKRYLIEDQLIFRLLWREFRKRTAQRGGP